MIPLSSAQLGLWFAHQIDPDNSRFSIQLAFRLTGPLDSAALEEGLRDVVRRHESLRTVFRDDGADEPNQVVLDGGERAVVLEREDVAEENLRKTMSAVLARPFDLTSDLPFRSWLFALAPQENVLVLAMHHIVSDGWSLHPLTRDLAHAYASRRRGVAPDLPALPVRYADYVLWHRQLLGSDRDPDSLLAKDLAYWRAALDGMPEEMNLPVDRPRRPVPSGESGMIVFALTPELHAALAALAGAEGATLFMVLQAGLAVLLNVLGAGTDIPLGSSTAGRMDDALTDVVGCFVNIVVLRTDLSGDPTARELIRRIREVNLAAYEHQDIPFERLVQALRPRRVSGRHPLIQVLLTLLDDAESELGLAGLEETPLDIDVGGSAFDLGLSMTERLGDDRSPAGVGAWLEYQPDLFDETTVQGFADEYLEVLQCLVADPDAPISGVTIPTQR